jgi:hypothetical protein
LQLLKLMPKQNAKAGGVAPITIMLPLSRHVENLKLGIEN